VKRAGPAAVRPSDDSGHLHLLKFCIGRHQFLRIQPPKPCRDWPAGGHDVVLYLMFD
jgi:hypothetical protein